MRQISFLLMAGLVLGAAGFAAFQEQPPVTPVTPLATIRGIDVQYVAPSLGTTRLYFSDGDSGLWMYDRAARRTTFVSRGVFWEPNISSTADRIAFYRGGEDDNTWHIWSMPLDPTTGLAAGPARRASMSMGDVPSLSPDGRWIAFGRDDSLTQSGQTLGQAIAVVPTTGGPERILARLSGGVWNLNWTPDGQSIYFATGFSGRETLTVRSVPITGGQPNLVMETTGNAWLSPDGRALLTTSDRGQQLRHVISDPSGKKLGEFALPARHVVTDWTGPSTLLTRKTATPTSIATVSLVDGRVRRVTDSIGEAFGPAWSPDGRQLAYQQWNGSKVDLVIVNADGTGKKTFSEGRDLVADPALRRFNWSPDGSSINFPVRNDSTIPIQNLSSSVQRVVKVGNGLRGAHWMPDSRSFLWMKVVDSTATAMRLEFHLVSFDGRERVLREITSNCSNYKPIGDSLIVYGCREGTAVASLRSNAAPRFLFPGDTSTGRSVDGSVSPDGRWVVFRVRGAQGNALRALDVVRIDGSARHRIELPVRALGGMDNPVITRDSRDLIFIGSEFTSNERGVYRVPLAGGEVRKVASLRGAATGNTNRDYSISRDGNTIAYVAHGEPTTMLGEINLTHFLPPAPRR